MAEKSHEFWVLSTATKYESSGRGMPRPKSCHRFGWNATRQQFELHNEFGLGQTSRLYLPMSVELAEAFLMKCLDPEFNKRFLIDFYPSQPAEHTIEAGNEALKLQRGRVQLRHKHESLPGLSLTVPRAEDTSSYLFLWHELRASLGNFLSRISAEEIRAHLYPQAAAA